jgi:serine phosphatase RsbU (regulator of sigma subunit)/Tfp pilus assembly protein PilF
VRTARKIYFASLLFSVQFLSAQSPVADSLRNVIRKSADDTNKVQAIYLLTFEFNSTASFDSSLKYCNAELALTAKLLEGKLSERERFVVQKGRAYGYNGLGLVGFYSGNYPEALKNHSLALEIRKNIGDKKGESVSYNNIGLVLFYQGNYPEALKTYFRALRLMDSIGYKKGMADCYGNMGSVYQEQGNTTEALKYQKLSLELYREVGDKQGVAGTYGNIGNIYQLLKNYPEALSYDLKCAAMMKETGDRQGQGIAYMNMGYLYMLVGDDVSAERQLNYASGLQEEIGDKQGLATTLANKGELYLKMHRFDDARKNYAAALRIAPEVGSKKDFAMIYTGLSRLDSATGDFKRALQDYKFARRYDDSLVNEDNIRKTVQVRMQYDFDRKEAERQAELNKKDEEAKEKEKLKEYRSFVIYVISGVLLISFASIAFVLFRRYRLKQRLSEELSLKNNIIERRNKDITDSIQYAFRIQQSILPREAIFRETFRDHFVYYSPKDVVSGDFYWLEVLHTTPKSGERSKVAVLGAIDCTGHGVPGALMSIVGNTLLNQTIKNPDINSPADALNFLNRELPKNLKSGGADDTIRDGMDMVLCTFNFNSKRLDFAGANNSIYIVRNGALTELKGDKQPISSAADEDKKDFVNHSFDLLEGDCVYLFTDGLADQFGGPKGKKFKYKQLEELLIGNARLPLSEQKNALHTALENWKGDLEQVDDILVIGVRI